MKKTFSSPGADDVVISTQRGPRLSSAEVRPEECARSGGLLSRRSFIPSLAVVAFLLAGGSICAHEPDGRVVFRTVWLPTSDGASTKVLRLIVTPVVPLDDAELAVELPKSASLAIHATVVAGTPIAGAWPSTGLLIGPIAAGKPLIFDLDVTEPSSGGGTLVFRLAGRTGGIPVREGYGVTLGHPGPPGVLRGNVLEYPAEPGGQAP